MSIHPIEHIVRTPAVFTAGDLVEGLEFMPAAYRRAVLFGIDNRLTADQVVELTHARALRMQLSPLSAAIVAASPRHIRLDYLFWHQEDGGLITPLLGIGRMVAECFGGMSWADLSACYQRMVWVDDQADADEFRAHLRPS